MLKHYIVATAAAVVCSGAVIAAQAAPGNQTPQQQTQRPTDAGATAQSVVTGCVYREEDVPGRAPNPAERAGILEDYILAAITPSQAASPSSSTPGATGTSGTAATSGGSMYKLEFVDDERLSAMVGKRVEVTGRIEADSGDAVGRTPATPPVSQTDKVIGRDRIDLPEFEVASLREVPGACPDKPAAR